MRGSEFQIGFVVRGEKRMQGKLLILDDNERVFESLEINFRQFGFNCVWAANGAEALRLARDCRLLAAIIDLSLQDEDGVDVMRRLFAVQSDMPAIVITGFGSFADAVRATKLGAYDFLAKPLNFDKLNEVRAENDRQRRHCGCRRRK